MVTTILVYYLPLLIILRLNVRIETSSHLIFLLFIICHSFRSNVLYLDVYSFTIPLFNLLFKSQTNFIPTSWVSKVTYTSECSIILNYSPHSLFLIFFSFLFITLSFLRWKSFPLAFAKIVLQTGKQQSKVVDVEYQK